jgi:hypothetical protein
MKQAKQSARRRGLHNQRRIGRLKRRLGKLLTRENVISCSRDSGCDHNWQRDGQTMTAVRWYCAKCGESKFT